MEDNRIARYLQQVNSIKVTSRRNWKKDLVHDLIEAAGPSISQSLIRNGLRVRVSVKNPILRKGNDYARSRLKISRKRCSVVVKANLKSLLSEGAPERNATVYRHL